MTDNNELGSILTSHPDVRKVSFTGSTATGRKVMSSAALSLKRLTLELGGNDAGIVLEDADPSVVAPAIFRGAFANNGQACIALKRLYVPDALYDTMCDALVTIAEAAVVGPGSEPDTQLGPLQNMNQLRRVEELVEDARGRGVIATGGSRLPRPGFFFAPTIVRDIDDDAPLVREEQFGPVLPILRYTDLDDAIARANDCAYGLGSSIWSADPKRAALLASRLEAGTVWINKHMDGGPNIPLGGAKQSGIGVEFGEEGLNEYTQIQVVDVNLGA